MENAKPYSTNDQGPFPIHRGPFLFGPDFLCSVAWSTSFRTLIEKILLQTNVVASVVCSPDDCRLARIEFQTAEVIVDGQGGMFSVSEKGSWGSDSDDFMSHWSGPLGPPKLFFQSMNEPKNIARLGIDYQNVHDFVLSLYQAMEQGAASITACLEMPPAPSIQIPFQQLCYLDLVERDLPFDNYLIEDLQLDEAVKKDGSRVYCLGVLAISSAKVSALDARSTAARARTPRGDKRELYPRDLYEPIIRSVVKDVKRQFGVRATQAEVKRRATAKFVLLGLRVPKKTRFEQWVRKIFKAK
jgi:hypothetical protein